MVHLVARYRESIDEGKKGILGIARNLLDRGIHSRARWWASKRPWYSPDMILRGLSDILLASVNAKRSFPDSVIPDFKDCAQLIFEDMLKTQNKIILSLN